MNSSRKKQRSTMTWVLIGLALFVCIAVGTNLNRNNAQSRHLTSTYIEFIRNPDFGEHKQAQMNIECMRFALGFINEDDIPELILCYGTSHVDQVYVYSFNPQSRAVEDWGSFSSFGTFSYFERQGIVVSQYGGMGFWYHIYERVGLPEKNVLVVEGSYPTEDKTYYYWQSPYCGTIETLWNDYDFDSIAVTQEEYVANLHNFLANYTDEINIGYDNMTEYSEDNLRIAIQRFE